MLASPNFRIQRVKWKFKSTLQERTVIDRALVSLSDCWIFAPSQLTRFTRHKIKHKPICALIGEYEGMRVKFNLVWRCRSTWGGRRRNLTNQQLQSFLACFPQTIVNLDSRMETIFQKRETHLNSAGEMLDGLHHQHLSKRWVYLAPIISTNISINIYIRNYAWSA